MHQLQSDDKSYNIISYLNLGNYCKKLNLYFNHFHLWIIDHVMCMIMCIFALKIHQIIVIQKGPNKCYISFKNFTKEFLLHFKKETLSDPNSIFYVVYFTNPENEFCNIVFSSESSLRLSGSDMVFCVSIALEDLSEIVEGYEEIIKILVYKPISRRVSTKVA